MTVPARKSPWGDIRRWLPGVLISLVVIFMISRLATWQDLGAAFQALPLLNIGAAALLSLISLLVRAQAWRVLLGGRPTFRQSFFILNEGYMLNNLFPLRAGEIGRAVFMGRALGISPFHVLSSIVIERAFDLAIAAGLLLSTLPLALGLDWARPVGIVTLGLVTGALMLLFLMARYPERVQTIALSIGGRWNFFKKFLLPQVDALLDGLGALRSLRTFLVSLGWLALTWVFWVLVYYVVILALVPTAPLWWAMFTDSVLAVGAAVPSAPASLGIYEGSLMAALTLLGISTSLALAYAIVMHFIQFALTGILGMIGLALDRKSIAGIQADLFSGNSTSSE
jgi:uncharacterized protein (TIRG00374 family)